MNDIVPSGTNLAPAQWTPEALDTLSAEVLKQLFAHEFLLDVGGMERKAMLLQAMERKGVDLSGIDVDGKYLDILRRVAERTLDGELASKIMWCNWQLNLFCRLPLTIQRKIAAGETFDLVTYTPDGTQTHRKISPLEMNGTEAKLLFQDERGRVTMRNERQQLSFLDIKARKKAEQQRKQPSLPLVAGRFLGDVGGKQFLLGKVPITFDEVAKLYNWLTKAKSA